MKFRNFSNVGWQVSEIGLGCWAIGSEWGEVTPEDARDVLKTSLDKGINFFDTADVYGDGRSEKFVGELIKSTKEKIYFVYFSINEKLQSLFNLTSEDRFISWDNLLIDIFNIIVSNC